MCLVQFTFELLAIRIWIECKIVTCSCVGYLNSLILFWFSYAADTDARWRNPSIHITFAYHSNMLYATTELHCWNAEKCRNGDTNGERERQEEKNGNNNNNSNNRSNEIWFAYIVAVEWHKHSSFFSVFYFIFMRLDRGHIKCLGIYEVIKL